MKLLGHETKSRARKIPKIYKQLKYNNKQNDLFFCPLSTVDNLFPPYLRKIVVMIQGFSFIIVILTIKGKSGAYLKTRNYDNQGIMERHSYKDGRIFRLINFE